MTFIRKRNYLPIRDFKFLQRWISKVKSSGMWCRVVSWKFTGVSDERTASSQRSRVRQAGGTTQRRIPEDITYSGIHQLDCSKMSHPRRPKRARGTFTTHLTEPSHWTSAPIFSTGTLAILSQVLIGFRKSLQENSGIFSHDRFLLYPFQYSFDQSSYVSTLHILRC
jgi:hypothetical protein